MVGMHMLRILYMVQIFFTLYLFYVSFYSAKNKFWNKIGVFMHLIAELMVFLVMPVSIIACSIMNMDSLKDKPQASLFLAFAICSLGEILIGGLIFGRISVQTWRWYKNRR